ncbi:molybdopterin synthase catalytic subunit MoaE [Thalassotalea euphylliae]|uniref:Molybdopterin synthase catalytic subunit n=1 Tax=Thalassotalea euphylliae TaxID=1655234 RepID=A0A3E0TVU5_9GAMM|nr:molybdopterin synthase catalytic subunit MoaE [Thalassotalea euphylliae]REL28801.1 molybdopterin synthase catalytic subunit MoaE [Thalassotalea euphylliae]
MQAPPLTTKIQVNEADFDAGDEIALLQSDNLDDGAVVTFTGRVRKQNEGQQVTGLFLEHYPAMTERSLANIVEQARAKWQINRVTVIHRVGQLSLGDNIVFVGVTSAHRTDAFHAAEFMMDYLKVEAPFWKKETRHDGDVWIDARQSDQKKAIAWS